MAADQRLEELESIASDIERKSAILYVQVLRGSNLYKTDLHAIDPYVEVALGAESSRSVALLRAGSNPVFDWSMAVPFDPRDAGGEYGDGLTITVWDQDIGAKDDEVGRDSLPLASILKWETAARAFRGEVPLVHQGRISGRKKAGGSVEVAVYWVPTSECQRLQRVLRDARQEVEVDLGGAVASASDPPPSPVLPLPRNYCITNFNKLAGVAQTIIDKGKVSQYTPYRMYSMRLWHVNLVFRGFTKGWNKGYKAAQQIYGTSLPSKSVRAGLRLQNYMAYSNDYTHRRCEVLEVSGAASLRKMLQSYHAVGRSCRMGSKIMRSARQAQSPAEFHSTRYTYVIMPDSHMHFSATSKATATDFLSKHALHAGAAEAVVYSGEFFFDTRSRRAVETGTSALVIDNNSGTFAPPKEKLHLLKLLMQLNFGTEMPVLALDREDPLLAQLSKENEIE